MIGPSQQGPRSVRPFARKGGDVSARIPVSLSPLVVALLAVALVLGAQCAASATTKVSEAKLGFSFSLPNHWQPIPLNGSDIKGLLDLATKADSSLKSTLSSEIKHAEQQGVKFFAVGPVTHHSLPNVNIIEESSSGVPTGKAFFQQGVEIKLQMTSSGFKNVKTNDVTLGFGKVVQATYAITSALTSRTVHGDQFYILHKSHLFIVCVFRSFRTPNPEFSYTSRWDRRPRSGRRCCEIRSS